MPGRMLRSIWRDSEGSALVEATIILPVLFILVFGVFEFSWAICQQHLILTGISRCGALYCPIRDPQRSNDETKREISGNHRVDRW